VQPLAWGADLACGLVEHEDFRIAKNARARAMHLFGYLKNPAPEGLGKGLICGVFTLST
jgi:hypothetical protein